MTTLRVSAVGTTILALALTCTKRPFDIPSVLVPLFSSVRHISGLKHFSFTRRVSTGLLFVLALTSIAGSVFVVAVVSSAFGHSTGPSPSSSRIEVNVTSFNVQFVYTKGVGGYYHLVSQGYLCSQSTNQQTTFTKAGATIIGNVSGTYNCDTFSGTATQVANHPFLDFININSTTVNAYHVIDNISVSTPGFKLVPIDISLPKGIGAGGFTLAVYYVGATNYTGPVDIQVYSSS
jgi:hypothetical protein